MIKTMTLRWQDFLDYPDGIIQSDHNSPYKREARGSESNRSDYRSRNQSVRKRLEETPAGFEDGGNGNEPSNADSL